MASAEVAKINARKNIAVSSLLFPPSGLPIAAVIIELKQGWQLWAVETTPDIQSK
jgi:hypothetical protein